MHTVVYDRSDLLNDDCGIIEYSVQLQLRLCLSETSAEQSDAFPLNVILRVNDSLLPLQVPTWSIIRNDALYH